VNALVCQAIRERRIIRLHYDGGLRDVEPHFHGASSEGNDLLRAYQVGGYSRSGQPHGWRTFRLDHASALAVTDRTFSVPRPDYDPEDSSMATIYCRL